MVISLILLSAPMIKMCLYMLTSVNLYLIMQSLNVLLTFLALLLTVKQEFPIGGIVVSICLIFVLTLNKCFVKCPANSVSQLYNQYVYDLSCILDRHASLVSSLKMKQCVDWLSETYCLAKSLRHQFECAWHKDKSQYNRSRLDVKLPGVISRTRRRLFITGNLSLTTAMILRNYSRSYTKCYIDPMALLCPFMNPQCHWLIVLLHVSLIKS